MKLHGYQIKAMNEIIIRKKVALWLDMGLGKTAITLAAIEALKRDGKVKKVVVIAPSRVAESVWVQERDKWGFVLKVVYIGGSAVKRKRIIDANKDADVYVISRDLLKWFAEVGLFDHADMIVVDESSGFKHGNTQRFKTLKSVSAKVARMVLLSGTPADNYLGLWAQIYLLDRGERLGKYYTYYCNRYFTGPIINGYVIYNKLLKGAREEINDKLKDICISMKADDYLDLPKLLTNDIKIKLKDKTYRTYKQMARDYCINTDITANNAATLAQKLLQLSCGFCYRNNGSVEDFGTEKIDALKEILDDLDTPALVFCNYKRNAEILRQMGGVEIKTGKSVDDFNAGKIKLAYANPVSAGYGLNLQSGGHTVIFVDLPWSWEVYSQAVSRVYRQGQSHTVIVHRLICDGTIDERVVDVLAGKQDNERALFDAVKLESMALTGEGPR